jgi:hypothetical protein
MSFPFLFFGPVARYQRTGGREKEVDHAISVDMVAEASRLHFCSLYDENIMRDKTETTIVVVSGDRDMHPAILKVKKKGRSDQKKSSPLFFYLFPLLLFFYSFFC